MAISQFSWARSHYDLIVTSYINGWYLFWYQWKEDVHTYTLVVKVKGYMTFSIDNPEGVATTPLRKICLGKTLRITRVKAQNSTVHQMCIIHCCMDHLKRLFTDWKRVFMAWKDYLQLEKDYLQLWGNFCRVVSLFLITWHSFNQSMNKKIWMTYIVSTVIQFCN